MNVRNDDLYRLAFLAIILVFLAVLFGTGWIKDRQAPKAYSYNARAITAVRQESGLPLLKVVLPYEKRLPRAASPFGPGMDEELLAQFLADYNYDVRFFYARSHTEALDLLKAQRCDLVVGFGGQPAKEHNGYLAASPVYATFYPIRVSASGDASHVYSNVLGSGLKGGHSEPGGAVLLDPHTYSILAAMHKDLRTNGALKQSVGYRWFWNSNNFELSARMLHFWSSQEREEAVAEMRERYYGFMPKQAKHQDLRELASVVSDKMSLYSDAIAKAAKETGLDPLLLAAVIFQESRFDPSAISFTGVRGIMQLTTETANMLNVDRLDPEQCIMGGARYLSSLRDSLEHLDVSELDRWCLALAAYNQGPANLRNALRLAKAQGKGNSWPEMRQVYSKLQDSGQASKNFRSTEALAYVENVRYYYYVMSRLASIASGEEENLAPLLLLSAAS